MSMQVDSLSCSGNATIGGTLGPPRPRTELQTESDAIFDVPWTTLRVWDAVGTNLGAAASDDLGLSAGAHGTGCWYVTAGDLGAAGATTRRARFTFKLPPEYVAGNTVKIRCAGGMLVTIADTSCTVDFEAFKTARDTLKTGSDLVTTAATSINSVTFSNQTFTVTGTGLSPGDELDIRVTIICTDAATGPVVEPALAAIEMLLSIRG